MTTDTLATVDDTELGQLRRACDSYVQVLAARDKEIKRLRADLAETSDSLRVAAKALNEDERENERLRGLVDACSVYLKEDETPAQRIERERADTEAVLKLLLKDRREIEHLRAECLRLSHAEAETMAVVLSQEEQIERLRDLLQDWMKLSTQRSSPTAEIADAHEELMRSTEQAVGQ